MSSHRVMLLLALTVVVVVVVIAKPVEEKRISQIKCKEYRPNPSIFVHKIVKNCFWSSNLDVEDGEFPHQALLGRNNYDRADFYCGGVLISDRYVLTAAHCMAMGRPNIVRLGEIKLWVKSGYERDIRIESIVLHPDHSFNAPYHDIALIKLNETVTFSEFIRPACLWSLDNETSTVMATGYGTSDNLFNEFTMSSTLRKVHLGFVNQSECEQQYLRYPMFQQGILDSQLCIDDIHDVCLGDLGSPVHIISDPRGYSTCSVTGLRM